MSIEFSCIHCGRPLFSRDDYAGLLTACPQCETRQLIPQASKAFESPIEVLPPGLLSSAAPAFMIGPTLIDMERVAPGDVARAEQELPVRPVPSSSALARGMSVVTTCLTALFLAWITVGFLHEPAKALDLWMYKEMSIVFPKIILPTSPTTFPTVAWGPIILNCILVGALIPLSRALRTGPAGVLLLTGAIILFSMPLNVGLGMPLPAPEKLIDAAAILKAREMQLDVNLTAAHVRMLAAGLFGFTGLLMSLPLWLAGGLALHEPKVR